MQNVSNFGVCSRVRQIMVESKNDIKKSEFRSSAARGGATTWPMESLFLITIKIAVEWGKNAKQTASGIVLHEMTANQL